MINSAVIMGRLTADPELRTTSNGINVTSFSVAVDRSFVKNGEDRQADFINIVAWRGTAEFVTKYFHKGSMIAVCGSIRTRRYEDKTGAPRTAFEIVANEVSFCGGKTNPSDSMPPAALNAQPVAFQSADIDDFSTIDDDDDLPF